MSVTIKISVTVAESITFLSREQWPDNANSQSDHSLHERRSITLIVMSNDSLKAYLSWYKSLYFCIYVPVVGEDLSKAIEDT